MVKYAAREASFRRRPITRVLNVMIKVTVITVSQSKMILWAIT